MYRSIFAAMLLSVFSSTPAFPQSSVAEAENGRVGIITGGVSGTYVRFGADMSAVLDNFIGTDADERLRVVTMLGKGSVQNVRDLLYLERTDFAIVQSDVLESILRYSPDSKAMQRIEYITKLYNEEVHVLAREELRSLNELGSDQIVAVGTKGSGTQMTANLILDMLGVEAERVFIDDYASAIADMKDPSGDIDVLFYVSGKPVSLLRDLEQSDGVKLLALPLSNALDDTYTRSEFTPDDYPELVNAKSIETVAVNAVLAVWADWSPNTSRYDNIVRFCRAFAVNLGEFLEPGRHPKWKQFFNERNFYAKVPGWTRYRPCVRAFSSPVSAEKRTIIPLPRVSID